MCHRNPGKAQQRNTTRLLHCKVQEQKEQRATQPRGLWAAETQTGGILLRGRSRDHPDHVQWPLGAAAQAGKQPWPAAGQGRFPTCLQQEGSRRGWEWSRGSCTRPKVRKQAALQGPRSSPGSPSWRAPPRQPAQHPGTTWEGEMGISTRRAEDQFQTPHPEARTSPRASANPTAKPVGSPDRYTTAEM